MRYAREHPHEAAQILEGITRGIDVDFQGDRSAERFGPNLRVEEADVAKVSAIIAADVAAGKKAGPFDSPPLPNFVVSPIGAVPKKEVGRIRVIPHLSYPFGGDSVNASVRDETMTLGSVAEAAGHILAFGRGCWLVKLDVEAAYKQVPVRPQDWHLLGFKWEGKYYYERVLPFGLKSSCRLWELYAAALHFFFSRHCKVPAVVHYIDDFLLVFQSEQQAREGLAKVLMWCRYLGVPMAADKLAGPATCLTFLGIELDTVELRARLPAAKLLELKELAAVCVRGLDDQSSTVRVQMRDGMRVSAS